ncbi:GlxA family transcriptional regulator [Gilvimarinus xylanilyticus]|uniref:Helix-turn-helix domain-containing protein n=1 Tax=Gilvimarinus xylanilyticus TaxID=2944139 RepID=A0A9X2HTJ0_9GAMM|nr:helix-turn-helix domain-containing protein [Gilvimarinus xylanilyticus]MCP8898000.1 helix-turn-helix domain-containing protein [Gilvimarinus xylanilyticus]
MSETRITFVLSENMMATGTALPMEMLRTAALAARRQTHTRHHRLILSSTAETLTPFASGNGWQWQAEQTLAQNHDSDIIYLPALWRNPRPTLQRSQALLDWLQAQHARGATLCAVSTGVCFLAEAGLLDGKAATTHWHYFDQFERDYPQVALKRQHFITQAGNIYCAASVNSLADLTVHFIQKLFDSTLATHVERHFSHEIRRPYESLAFYDNLDHPHPDELIVQVQSWLREHYARIINIGELAQRFGMSTRTFNRRFKEATGCAPLEYLRQVRINTAQDLLRSSNYSITEIAAQVGYADTAYFTERFKQQLDITPSDYRATVRAKLFHTD